jgi:DUF971 family protein
VKAPKDLQLIGERTLGVIWDDGHESLYDVIELRKACPCATCKDRRERGRSALPKSVTEESVALARIEPVGRYAVRIVWAEGHDTGIYSFAYLRELCPCDACSGRRARKRAGSE